MTTFDDDYLQFEDGPPGMNQVIRVDCRNLGVHWPPPEQVWFADTLWRRESFSQIPDADRARMPFVMRGSLYKPKTVDPDRPCPHDNHQVLGEVYKLTAVEGGPVIGYKACFKVRCVDCGERYQFIGPGIGDMPDRPTVSVDRHELRIPLRPDDAMEDFGSSLGGFELRELPDDGG